MEVVTTTITVTTVVTTEETMTIMDQRQKGNDLRLRPEQHQTEELMGMNPYLNLMMSLNEYQCTETGMSTLTKLQDLDQPHVATGATTLEAEGEHTAMSADQGYGENL